MSEKEKAEELVNEIRLILMDTEYGDEILCTSVAIQMAHVVADNVIKTLNSLGYTDYYYRVVYWINVKEKLEEI